MISARNLSKLPDIAGLRRLFQSLAMLDAILSPEWEHRYYSFNCHWAPEEELGSMRNGCGDELFALFNQHGCFIKGFSHEAIMTPSRDNPPKLWPGLFSKVPQEFSEFLNEPAIDIENSTFCFWRHNDTVEWQLGDLKFPAGNDPDGSGYLLTLLDGAPETYCVWAEEYYQETWNDSSDLTRDAVAAVYGHQPLSNELVSAINSNLRLEDLTDDLLVIGYPIQNKPA
ncbi:hypothetical protein CA54_54650 [Symmachiella macrocystis]|uniref:Uncharacterized protein n=1 Tax=Symmachiella macrocystis TaxID=2527985 RepID=A0A5C6B548_9PLAN|nr:hypothetical protein [Symmachiella macrocystis]TWU07060.1 hypothetical protein CA54_54650 [Symmachiella macrocystis]